MNKFKQAREAMETYKAKRRLNEEIIKPIDDAIEALAIAERMVWREMDTAPHGEWILISAYGSVCQACWSANGYWVTFSNNTIRPIAAEKWMPLPEAKGLEDA